ncbi:MAG: 30S ribosomal protein S1 [Patescibacteria group bacterium]
MSDILDTLAQEVDKIEETPQEETPGKAPEKENSAMENLLSEKELAFPVVGEVVEGTVVNVSSQELYLDLGTLGVGIVMGKEIKDGLGRGKLKIGDKVNATIIESENEDGFVELSVREASHEKAWDDIESKRDTQDVVSTKVLGVNKGGLLIEINGISGFLPVSQLSSQNYPRVEDGDKNKILSLLKKLQGQELTVRILDANREDGKLIVSEKAAQSEKEKELVSQFSIGDIVDGEVSGVVDFGAFIKFLPKNATEISDEGKLEGLVHISELAWQLIENPRDIIKVGDKVKARIIGIDNDKISLSIRALLTDPWSEIDEKYKAGDVVKGKVNKINHFGAFVYLDKDIHGLAHISEMSENFPGKSLDELLKTGEEYDWKILSIEPKEHRMGLLLVKK